MKVNLLASFINDWTFCLVFFCSLIILIVSARLSLLLTSSKTQACWFFGLFVVVLVSSSNCLFFWLLTPYWFLLPYRFDVSLIFSVLKFQVVAGLCLFAANRSFYFLEYYSAGQLSLVRIIFFVISLSAFPVFILILSSVMW